MTEEVLFRASNIEITPKVARFARTSYQIANIGSVAVHIQRKMSPFAVLLVIIAVGLGAWWYSAQSKNQDEALWIFLAAVITLIGAMVVQNIWPKRIYTLILKTSSGDIQALVSEDGEHVERVHTALEDAFIRRT